MSDRLILRTVNSPFLIPYNDNTKGNVLSHTELDNNFLYLKGNIIYTAETSGSFVTLKKLNGEDFTFQVGSGGGGAGGDFYWTSGSTGTKSIKVNNGTGLDATGNYSVSEGYDTLASGNYSHAEGYNSHAEGNVSHAEGTFTISKGIASHAEGSRTTAEGDYSHSGGISTEGSSNLAFGEASFTYQKVTGLGYYGVGTFGSLGDASAVLGGSDNKISTSSSFGSILGGNDHYLFGSSQNSSIVGGTQNLIIDTWFSVVMGGAENGTIQADNSAVIAGYNNLIDAFLYNGPAYGFIGGGTNNKIQTGGGFTDESSVIMGGNGNLVEFDNQYNGIYNSFNSRLTAQDTSTIIGSYQSFINDNTGGLTSHNNIIINASDSYVDGFGVSHANILGGSNNFIAQNVDGVNQPNFTSIINGYGNSIQDSDTAVILNGFQNIISVNSKQSSIINGQEHSIASSQFSAIIGGNSNEMTDSDGSALIGGSNNGILSDSNPAFTRYYNAILGGTGNTINNSELSFIMGGYQNVIPYGTVGSVILGGDSITATSNNTVFVQRLNIKYAQNDNLTTKILTIDANGLVKYRDVSSISGGGGGGTSVDLNWSSGSTGTYSIKANNGTTTDATANYAVAYGFNTLASGIYSHAEGYGAESRGQSSHAQNEGTLARGDYSHAGGFSSTASGSTSFVHSYQSTVNGNRSAVIGGQAINGSANDTVYVPFLNVQSASTDNSLTSFLVRNGDGTIKTRTLPTDVRVTGGTYSSGTAVFTNNTGGTFSVTGFKTSDTFVTGGTYNNSTGTAIFTNNSGNTFNVTGFSTGSTSVTGFTYSNNNLTIKQSSGDLTVNINTMTGLTINGNLTFTGQTNNPVYTAGTLISTFTPNWDNSNIQQVILSAATTTIANGTNVKNGAVYTMIVKQNATGSRVVTWGSQYKWQSGIAPVLTTTANSVDILTFISDGTNLYGLLAKDFR